MNVDLSLLPVPDLVETLDYEDEYQGILGRFRVAMGDQWSAVLESDPVVKLLEEVAYERMTMASSGSPAEAGSNCAAPPWAETV